MVKKVTPTCEQNFEPKIYHVTRYLAKKGVRSNTTVTVIFANYAENYVPPKIGSQYCADDHAMVLDKSDGEDIIFMRICASCLEEVNYYLTAFMPFQHRWFPFLFKAKKMKNLYGTEYKVMEPVTEKNIEYTREFISQRTAFDHFGYFYSTEELNAAFDPANIKARLNGVDVKAETKAWVPGQKMERDPLRWMQNRPFIYQIVSWRHMKKFRDVVAINKWHCKF
jgi:hypothetical protein